MRSPQSLHIRKTQDSVPELPEPFNAARDTGLRCSEVASAPLHRGVLPSVAADSPPVLDETSPPQPRRFPSRLPGRPARSCYLGAESTWNCTAPGRRNDPLSPAPPFYLGCKLIGICRNSTITLFPYFQGIVHLRDEVGNGRGLPIGIKQCDAILSAIKSN